VFPASTVEEFESRSTVLDGVQFADGLSQPAMVLWLVPRKTFGVDAKYLGFTRPLMLAVVELKLVIAPVVARGIAVITDSPSLRLPFTPCV
jgi:hypothetical protein